MTNQSSADSFIPDILSELKAIKDAEDGHGLLCVDALDHAIACGKLLNLAKENVQAEVVEGKKGKWSPWLERHIGIPQTTASLYMRLARNEELLFEHKQRVATEKLSIRQAAQLCPKDDKAKKQSATAAEKAANKKIEDEAKARQATVASLSTEERVGDLALDDIFSVKGDDLGVDEIFMTLTSKLDNDQLIDLKDRLVSYLDEEAEEPAEAEPVADAPPPASVEELKQRQSRLFPHTPRVG